MKIETSKVKLLDQAVNIREQSVFERDDLGFATRFFVQCSLPHRNPGNDLKFWARTNGNFCLSIQPHWYIKEGKEICVGYPYGNIPRLILLYVCTQAIQTKSPRISLGSSLSAFMRNIELEVTGGRGGTIGRFKEQFRRLFTANINFTFDSGEQTLDKKTNLAKTIQLWWDNKDTEQTNFFDSYIILTEEFYNEIMTYPVPLDMGIISTVKQSPLALDLYTWLTHRVISLGKATRISWISLAGQVGSDYSNLEDFVTKAKEALHKLYVLWPDLKIEEVRGGLILKPCKPSVPLLGDNLTK